MFCYQIASGVPPSVVGEHSSTFVVGFFAHEWTCAQRNLTRGAHPGGFATDFTLAAKFARLGSVLVFLGFGNTNGDVLILFRVVEAKFDQILLDGKAVECGVLDGPLRFALTCLDDGVDFFVGGYSGGSHVDYTSGSGHCGLAILARGHSGRGGGGSRGLELFDFVLEFVLGDDELVDDGACVEDRLVKLLDELRLLRLPLLEAADASDERLGVVHVEGDGLGGAHGCLDGSSVVVFGLEFGFGGIHVHFGVGGGWRQMVHGDLFLSRGFFGWHYVHLQPAGIQMSTDVSERTNHEHMA